jgi:hypothetical protein
MSQKPTAAQILRSWDETQQIFRKTSAWLAMLRIAAGGSQGITISDLNKHHFSAPDRRTLDRYIKAGLILIQPNPCTYGANRHLHPRYIITKKGSRFLRIQHHTDKNANLSAITQAAPDLLAALQRLLRANEADYELAPGMDIATAFETNSQAIEQSRAAIAQALAAKPTPAPVPA